jgi:hypothetical protein
VLKLILNDNGNLDKALSTPKSSSISSIVVKTISINVLTVSYFATSISLLLSCSSVVISVLTTEP